jgi:hypothetical protein
MQRSALTVSFGSRASGSAISIGSQRVGNKCRIGVRALGEFTWDLAVSSPTSGDLEARHRDTARFFFGF